MNDTVLRMHYIGACSLLGRIAGRVPKGDQDRYPIERAMADCAKLTGMVVIKTSGNGFTLEPKPRGR